MDTRVYFLEFLFSHRIVILSLLFFWLQIDRISGIAAKYVGKPLTSYSHLSSHVPSRSLDLGVGNFGVQSGFVGEMYGGNDLFRSITGPTDADKPMIVELAVAAMEELVRMTQAGEPLWVSSDNSTEILNEEEYLRTFPRGIGPKPLGLKTEASRESVVVIMNHISLVEILMDVVGTFPIVFIGLLDYINIFEMFFTLMLFSESMVICVLRYCFKSNDFRSPINRRGREL